MKRKFIHKQKFKNRHRARELAVQFLYSLDVNPEEDFLNALELFLSMDDLTLNETEEVKSYCRELVKDVLEHSNEVDRLLLRTVTGWSPSRMVSVDRVILKLTIVEGFIIKKLPAQSAFAEAAMLANDFGTQNSARLVNGVLARVYKLFNVEKE